MTVALGQCLGQVAISSSSVLPRFARSLARCPPPLSPAVSRQVRASPSVSASARVKLERAGPGVRAALALEMP